MLQHLQPAISSPRARTTHEREIAQFGQALKRSTDTLFPKPILAPDGRVILAPTLPPGSTAALAPTLPTDGALHPPLPHGSNHGQTQQTAITLEALRRFHHSYQSVHLYRTTWILGRVIGYSEAVPFQAPRQRENGGYLAVGGIIAEQLRSPNGEPSSAVKHHRVDSITCPPDVTSVLLVVSRDHATRQATNVRLLALRKGQQFNEPDPGIFYSPLWTLTAKGWHPHSPQFPGIGVPHTLAQFSGTLLS